MTKVKIDRMIKHFLVYIFNIDKISCLLLDDIQIAWEAPRYLYATSG